MSEPTMKKTRVLIAPNAFKHSLDATDVTLAIQEGLYQSNLDCVCECFPIGDGGDGTGELMIRKYNGLLIPAEVHNPFSRKITASFGLVDDGETAIIEMASASGLRLLKPDELNPLRATSFGTGQLMKLAMDNSIKKLVLAIGGSATVDGGTGILRALGVRFLNAAGDELITPDSLTELVHIDVSGLDRRITGCEVTILSDVETTLLGEQGSAAVFGPQKGATPEGVKKLNAILATFARVALEQTGIDMTIVKYGGAAGGVAAGLHALLNATIFNGIDYFLAFTDFDKSVAVSDLIITGEGTIDEQTLQGKGPYGVACRAGLKLRTYPSLVLRVEFHSSTVQR